VRREKDPIEIKPDQLTSLLSGTSFHWYTNVPTRLLAKNEAGLSVVIESDNPLNVTLHDWGEEYDLPIAILGDKDEASALFVEYRLHALRQLYATIYLIKTGRAKEIPEDADRIDLELKLLKRDERLQITSIGIGSVLVTLRSFAKDCGGTLVALVALGIPSIRQAVQRQARAEAEGIELDNRRKEFDLRIHQHKEIIKLGKELAKLSPAERDRLDELVANQMKQLGVIRPTAEEIKSEIDENDTL
jgi:hypothetical protein